MSKRARATKVEILSKDETGAIINIDYDCPHCHFSTGEIINVGASGVSTIDSDFETDQVCSVCNEEVIIECRL